MKQLRKSVEAYRNVNRKVDRMMEEIGMTSLINPDARFTDIVKNSLIRFDEHR